jgi:hypothetical protein
MHLERGTKCCRGVEKGGVVVDVFVVVEDERL